MRGATISLYVHFPFCESKCHYCDFYSIGAERTAPADAPRFRAALKREAELWNARLPAETRFDTVFFGGGTPSMTPAEDMRDALSPLLARVLPDAEWTMEANPSSIDAAKMREYRALGVNRVSMGVQSLRDDVLKRLGRVHGRDDAIRALEALFAAGFDNVSTDLICGVPDQTREELRSAIAELAAFPISHLSCYLLTLPATHPLARAMPPEAEQLAQLQMIHDELEARGFEHYEISNFAKPGQRARHNLAYWTGGSCLALGPSAHSHDAVAHRRWSNVRSLHGWAERLARGELPIDFEEELTPEQRRLEEWMLGLRLSDGIPASWIASEIQRARYARMLAAGWIEPHPADAARVRLTPRGLPISDQIVADLAGA